MAILSLTYGPNKIFKQISKEVEEIDNEVKELANSMLETLYYENGVGMAAPMVGVAKRIAVIDLGKNDVAKPYILINPEIINRSEEEVLHEEASLSFPGIHASIKRPKSLKISYLNLENKKQELEADGFLARVIQHEVDYLNGRTFLDFLSKMKRDMLLKKTQKFQKQNPPHVHSGHCGH